MEPFRFMTRLNLVELLGRQARNVPELLEGLRWAPGASIYYHTHRFLQQHHYLSPEPPNDFSFWTSNVMGMEVLGEQLACVDTISFHTIRALKDRFVEIVENYIRDSEIRNGDCPEGRQFHFMSCRTFLLRTRHQARDLKEFREILKEISINSIYFHIFEARLRLGRNDNDFSAWFSELGRDDLAAEIDKLDPYTMTLEGLRNEIVQRVSRYV